MLSHLSIGVSDLKRSLSFYDGAFAPLGYVRLWSREDAAGYGNPGEEEPFALKQEKAGVSLGSSPRAHLAFTARTREDVAAFHAAALKHGGTDRGAPGLRPHYGEDYFAAFVRDPDGYQLEAVCFAPLVPFSKSNVERK